MRSWLRRALPILLATALLAVPAAASARPGTDQARHSLRAPLTGENFYFLMADRFENGTTGNDLGGLPADRLVSGFDPTAKGFYHGGDLAGRCAARNPAVGALPLDVHLRCERGGPRLLRRGSR